MKRRLEVLLGLPPDRVSVKARSGEGLDSIGRGEALAVHCTVVVVSKDRP
jgi:2-C-methyl-D-erythritol 2,4-cyclodiphosphate synthase